MEKLDYKKEYKDLYFPKQKPTLIEVPKMKFIMVEGMGNPNSNNGEYQKAIKILYGLSFTIKMSKMGENKINGYFEYVVPPLEGLWWQQGIKGIDYSHKETFEWISMIRQPEFVDEKVFNNITDVQNPQGVLAVIEKKNSDLDIKFDEDVIVVLDDIQDPGNLGTILRTLDSVRINTSYNI